MLWLFILSIFHASSDSTSSSDGGMAILNLTGSSHNLVGLEAGLGWGIQGSSRGSSVFGIFGSAEAGWRGWRLRSGLGAQAAGEGGIAGWRIGMVGLSEGWTGRIPDWGPETTLSYNLLLLRTGMVFGETVPVRFVWSAGLGL